MATSMIKQPMAILEWPKTQPVFDSHIENIEEVIYVTGNMVTGYIVFSYDSSYAGGNGRQDIITNTDGLPHGYAQMPIICVGGQNAGKVGRVRITTTGTLGFYYSNLLGTPSETYLIPLNYAKIS